MRGKLKVLMLSLALPLCGQGLDLKFLDKYADKSTEKVTITLDENLMRLGAGFLGAADDKEARGLKETVSGLKSILIRSFKFAKEGEYDRADVETLFKQMQGWSQVVDVQEGQEKTGIWMKTGDKTLGGLVIIAAEPRELTVVSIVGEIDLEKLGKLKGNLGIPDVGVGKKSPAPAPKAAPKPAPSKQEEQELP